MSPWPTAAHFVSWLALCPDNDISGGKLLWRGARKVKNWVGHLFRMAAFSLHHSLTPLGNYLRRMKASWAPKLPPWQPPTKSQSSFTPWSKNKSNMTRPSGTRETYSGRKGWVQNSNGKPNNSATNLSPSNPKLHNELTQHM